MQRLLLLSVLLCPLRAELRQVVMQFQPTECASCTESLPERFKRIRGVESVQLDGEAKTLRIVLAAENRVRLSRLQESLQQDGTKLIGTLITGSGECARDSAGSLTFRPNSADTPLTVETAEPPAPGACSLSGARVK